MAVQVYGHRGARAVRPENTIPAFTYAIGAGVNGLELDIAVTKDNVLAVSHDPVLHPPVCRGPQPQAVIHELTLAEVKQWDCSGPNPAFPGQQAAPGARVPALDEVFDLAPRGSFVYIIETKSFPQRPELTPAPDEFAALVLDAIRRYHLESRVILQSFDFRTLRAMKQLAPEIRLSALYEGPPRSFVEIAAEAGCARTISPHYKLVTPEQVQAAHKAGLEVLPWTVNRPGDWMRLIAAGVDGIITDDPAALIEYLKAH